MQGHALADVLLPLRDAWVAAHPEIRECLRCGCSAGVHDNGGACMGCVVLRKPGICVQFATSWVSDTPSAHWHPEKPNEQGEAWR